MRAERRVCARSLAPCAFPCLCLQRRLKPFRPHRVLTPRTPLLEQGFAEKEQPHPPSGVSSSARLQQLQQGVQREEFGHRRRLLRLLRGQF